MCIVQMAMSRLSTCLCEKAVYVPSQYGMSTRAGAPYTIHLRVTSLHHKSAQQLCLNQSVEGEG